MPAFNQPISFRHRRLFDGLADLWQPSDPVGPSGGLARSYGAEPVLTGVPYVLDRKSAIDNPELVALLEGQDLITVDTARFPPQTNLHSSWIVVDRSVNISGSPSLNSGGGWICRGEPIQDDDLDRIRRAGMVEAYLNRLPKLPQEIVSYYA